MCVFMSFSGGKKHSPYIYQVMRHCSTHGSRNVTRKHEKKTLVHVRIRQCERRKSPAPIPPANQHA